MGCYGSMEQAICKPLSFPRNDIKVGTLSVKIKNVFLHKVIKSG